jgi:hypothetical protein
VFTGVLLSAYSYQSLMPGYLENELGHPASRVGLIYGVSAAGGVAASLAVAMGSRSADPVRQMFLFGGALGGSVILLALAPGLAAALGVAMAVGAASSGFQVLNNITLMERSRPDFFGRVMSVSMVAWGLNFAVAYPIGALADHVGERAMLGGLGLACMACVAAGLVAARVTGLHRRAALPLAAAEATSTAGPGA